MLLNILIKSPKGLWSVTHLVILVNYICRDSFVNYFRKYSGFRFPVFLAGLLCQANLIFVWTSRRSDINKQTNKTSAKAFLNV